MASSTRYQHELIKVAITCILINSFMVTLSKSDEMKSRKLVLGSRPPTCVNKCMNCKPCVATLVVHTHRQQEKTHEITSNDYG
ncbi:hypothetical protein KSS87_002179, partial [Heliosperma pusillum]